MIGQIFILKNKHKSENCKIDDSYLRTMLFYGSRTSPTLMAHYEYEEGAFTPCQEIVSDADRYKENVNASASGIYSLGSIIQDVWGTKVQKVRRRPRNNEKNVYLNLKRRQIANISMETERAVRSSLSV